jgi:TPR repeat protein
MLMSPRTFEAAKWIQKAAENGNSVAQVMLGDRYVAGDGVPHWPPMSKDASSHRVKDEPGIKPKPRASVAYCNSLVKGFYLAPDDGKCKFV